MRSRHDDALEVPLSAISLPLGDARLSGLETVAPGRQTTATRGTIRTRKLHSVRAWMTLLSPSWVLILIIRIIEESRGEGRCYFESWPKSASAIWSEAAACLLRLSLHSNLLRRA